MTPDPFDFRQPPPGHLERQLGDWVAEACRRATGAWARHLPYPARLTPGPVTAAASDGTSEDLIAFPLSAGDAADGPASLTLSRPLFLALLAGLLGDSPAALPADRDPTELEASLAGHLVRLLFLDPLEQTWPGGDPLALTAGATGPPRPPGRRGPGAAPPLTATLTVSAPFGDHPVRLQVPQSGVWEGLARRPAPPPAATDPAHIEALVREMAVELAVVLGTADLTMTELSALRAGDVVVLRQRVDEPLAGLVGGARKVQVWSGAVGTRAAVQVHAADA